MLNTATTVGPSGGGRRGGRAQCSCLQDDSSFGAKDRSGGRAGGRGRHPPAEDAGNIPRHRPGESPYNLERYDRELEETISMVRRIGMQQRSEDDPTENLRMPRQLRRQNACIPRGMPGRVEGNTEQQLRRSNFCLPPPEIKRAAAAAVAAIGAAPRQNAAARSEGPKSVRTAANAIKSPFLAAASSRNPLRLMPGSDPSQRAGAAATAFPPRRDDSSQN